MKKMSVLMAALTAVTVGGVYAAWTYAESDLTNISSTEQVINVAGIDTTTALKVGSFAIESKDLTFIIDSAESLKLTGETRYTAPTEKDGYYIVGTNAENYAATGNYHQHEAVLAVKGSITVTFTPAQQVADDILQNGLLTSTYFTNPSAITIENILWDGAQILKFENLAHTFGDGNEDNGKWTKTTEEGTTVFTYTYTAAELATMLTLKQGIILDTSAKHTTFSDKLDGLTVKLHVDQVKTTA